VKKIKKRKKYPRWVFFPAGLFFLFLILFYGPFKSFRLLWINTAMYSSNHKFLAKMLYSKKYINSVLDMNNPVFEHRTDNVSLVNAWDDDIQFAEIKGNYYKGFIIKINNPKRFIFTQADSLDGFLLEQKAEKHNAIGGINASGYADGNRRGIASGTVITDGQIVSLCSQGELHLMGGINKDYKFIVGKFTKDEIIAQNYLWAFEFGPLLIVNGEKMELTSFSGGLAPRTAIGQTAEGHILLVVVDGRQITSIGATFLDMQTILFANGAINAINLDGGSSTTMVYQSKVVNSPSDGDNERLLPNAILFR
jgi:exopolysaccharide biosynthesis protein